MNDNTEVTGKQAGAIPETTPSEPSGGVKTPEAAGTATDAVGQAATLGAPGAVTVAPEKPGKPDILPPPGGWGGRNPPPPQWPPGVSGNPKGHKKGVANYRANFKKLLAEVAEYKAPADTVTLIRKHFPDAPADMQVTMAEALRIHVAMLNGEAWAFAAAHGKDLSIELNGSMTMGLHDISNDELERRIKDIERRETIAQNGESAPTV